MSTEDGFQNTEVLGFGETIWLIVAILRFRYRGARLWRNDHVYVRAALGRGVASSRERGWTGNELARVLIPSGMNEIDFLEAKRILRRNHVVWDSFAELYSIRDMITVF